MFPTELYFKIFNNLELIDLKNLRIVSDQFNYLNESIIEEREIELNDLSKVNLNLTNIKIGKQKTQIFNHENLRIKFRKLRILEPQDEVNESEEFGEILKFKNLQRLDLTQYAKLKFCDVVFSDSDFENEENIQRDTTYQRFISLRELTNLTHINFSGTQVTYCCLIHLKGLINLKHLELRNCINLRFNEPRYLIGLINLEYLDLYHTRITIQDELKNLILLKHLDLSGCSLDYNLYSVALKNLERLTDLEYLSLERLQFNLRDVYDDDLIYLSRLTKLRVLRLTRCEDIEGDGLKYLKGLTNLEDLDLSLCCLYDNKECLSNLKTLKLTSLNLQSYGMEESMFEDITHMTTLKYLNLSGCVFTSHNFSNLVVKLSNLKGLVLSNSNLQDDELIKLKALTKLKYLDLSECNELTDNGMNYLNEFVNVKVIT
jgi:uncharacterized protein YjbI with pentapeptide repeats